jgi:lysozyme family protein
MAWFAAAIEGVLEREGGAKYTNRKSDSGGPTKYGITHKTLANWRGVKRCSPADVKALEESEACAIYKARYWDNCMADYIRDQAVASKIFDIAVNFGVMRRGDDAAEITQRAAVACGEDIRVDGWIGPKTIAAVNACDPKALIEAICKEQRKEYLEILAARPKNEPNRRGWLRRAKWKGVGRW